MRVLFWLYLLLKKQLKNPVITAFLIAIPVLTAIVTNVSSFNETSKPRVGIVALDTDPITKQMCNYLIKGDYSVEFYNAFTKEQLEKDIMDNGTECGYVIGNNLSEKLDSKDYAGAIELILCKSHFISSMTNEIVFSALFKAYSPEIAINYINSVEDFKKYSKEAEEQIRENYQGYLNGDETFHVKFKMLEGDSKDHETSDLEQKSGQFPIKQILMILVYIAGLFGTVQYYMDKEKGTFVTLPKGYRIAGKPLYAFIGSALFAISVEISLFITNDAGSVIDILKMLLYVAAVTLFAWALSSIVRSAKAMISVIPVLLIACMILCPVFINVTVYLPFTKYIRAFLLPWYMM